MFGNAIKPVAALYQAVGGECWYAVNLGFSTEALLDPLKQLIKIPISGKQYHLVDLAGLFIQVQCYADIPVTFG